MTQNLIFIVRPPVFGGFICRSQTRFCGPSLERVKGIEPSSSAWKAVALPLSYTRVGYQ
jgi:hypothetical protein